MKRGRPLTDLINIENLAITLAMAEKTREDMSKKAMDRDVWKVLATKLL